MASRWPRRGWGEGAAGAARGTWMVKVKVEPRLGSLVNETVPPMSSTMFLQIARPRPVPP